LRSFPPFFWYGALFAASFPPETMVSSWRGRLYFPFARVSCVLFSMVDTSTHFPFVPGFPVQPPEERRFETPLILPSLSVPFLGPPPREGPPPFFPFRFHFSEAFFGFLVASYLAHVATCVLPFFPYQATLLFAVLSPHVRQKVFFADLSSSAFFLLWLVPAS